VVDFFACLDPHKREEKKKTRQSKIKETIQIVQIPCADANDKYIITAENVWNE